MIEEGGKAVEAGPLQSRHGFSDGHRCPKRRVPADAWHRFGLCVIASCK